MDENLRNQHVHLELENIVKSIASWKRLVILDELSRYEEGRSYTELRKSVESINPQDKKTVRIDFHLEELRKINFVKKDRTYSLFHGQGKEVYKITYSGRIIQSFIASLLERQLFFTSPEEGIVFSDSVTFPRSLDMNSLILILDIAREFERVQTMDGVCLYWIISERIQRYPPLNNLTITFEFIEAQNDQSNDHEMKILAYWSKEAMESAINEYNIPSIANKDKFLQDSKLQNGLIFMIQQSLSKVRDIVYDLDAESAKTISDKIFEYLDSSRTQIANKLEFLEKKS